MSLNFHACFTVSWTPATCCSQIFWGTHVQYTSAQCPQPLADMVLVKAINRGVNCKARLSPWVTSSPYVLCLMRTAAFSIWLQLHVLNMIVWTTSFLWQMYNCDGVIPFKKVNQNFTITCLFSGSWRGVQDEETPSEQSESAEGVSQIRTPRAILSPEKAQPCKICVPVLRDILHLAEEEGTNRTQKAYSCRTCGKEFYFTANIQQHQKQYIRKKPFQYDMVRSSFLKSCTIHATGNLSTNMEIGNEFKAIMVVQPQATNTRKKLSNSKECEAIFHSDRSHQNWGEGKMASSHTDILVQNERILTTEGSCESNKVRTAGTQTNSVTQHQKVHTGERSFECSHCGKCFTHKSGFLAHQRFNCGGRFYDCSECGKSFS